MARGRPQDASNVGASIGWQGLRAPGDRIAGQGAAGSVIELGSTSVAAPFVTSAMALLRSAFPAVPMARIQLALLQASPRRRTLVSPLLNAAAAHDLLLGEATLRQAA